MVAPRPFKGLLHLTKKPFKNLSPAQRTLSVLRIGSSFLAICILVVIFALQNFPSRLSIARINCAHLDVAYGLYRSLRSSMTKSVISKGANEDVLPIDSGLSDSEISILTQYAQNQVSNAPQSFILGSKDWCTVNYVTDFSDMNNIYTNITTRCQKYGDLDFYDYRSLLMTNQLQIILAYAYERDNSENSHYRKRVELRSHRWTAMKVIYYIQLVQQVVLLVAGLLIYGNRGTARDLSASSKVSLNMVAVMSLTSGLTMIVSTAVVIGDLYAMEREIKRGLGDFGISMSIGNLYIALLWLALAFALSGMCSWTVPLWCSNPPDETHDLDEEVYPYSRGGKNAANTRFTAKPYQLRRQTQQIRTSSRLFDHVEQSTESMDNPFDDGPRGYSSPNETSISDNLPSESTGNVHSENELRKLSEKLSRNISVRHLNGHRRKKKVPEHSLLQKKDTHDLLYGPNPFSNHQYPQAYPQANFTQLDTPTLSRAASLTYDDKPSKSLRTRHLLEERDGQPQKPESRFNDSTIDDDASLLDEAEMQYLDNNRFMNNLTK